MIDVATLTSLLGFVYFQCFKVENNSFILVRLSVENWVRKDNARKEITRLASWHDAFQCSLLTSVSRIKNMDKTSLEKAAFINQNNATFAVDYNLQMHQEYLDDFRGIFAFKVFNWLMFAIYLLGYLCCFALALVIWFEYSGRAGPFRTLVNQLFSEILIQVSLKQKLNNFTF